MSDSQRNLDPRFRAVEAVPDPPHGSLKSDGPKRTKLEVGVHRALVLLAPGASTKDVQLPPNAIFFLPDTVLVEANFDGLLALANNPKVVYIEAPRPAGVELVDSVAATKADLNWAPPASLTGKQVIVGVVDYGFDFTLADFCVGGASRALALWDQSLTAQPHESAPAPFHYGVQYLKPELDAAVAAPSALPNAFSRHSPAASSHGTHVVGIAAGNGAAWPAPHPHIGVAYEADIVFVQPAQGAARLTDSLRVAEAIKYVFDFADVAGKPAVVNVSLGHNGAGHDGESVVERTIDRLLEARGRALVKSAGNEGEWKTHASGVLATGDTVDLEWIVGSALRRGVASAPGHVDRTPNTLEIWHSSRDILQISLIDPSGSMYALHGKAAGSGATIAKHPLHFEQERFHPLNGRARILLRVGPDPATGRVASGTWIVRLRATQAFDGAFDAWIELDLRDPLNSFADQSFFGNSSDDKTVTPPGTTRRGVAVGNFDHRAAPHALAKSSSFGPTADGRLKPEIVAPGVQIASSNALGGSSGVFRVAKTGTSMSAPHVAGAVAQLFQRDSQLTAAQIRSILIASAFRPGVGRGAGFDEQWGYGAVDAEEALKLVP